MKNLTNLFILLLVFCASCQKPADRALVIGKYLSNNKSATEMLNVKSDGTYEYYYKGSAGKEITNSDKWIFEYWRGKPLVTFSHFIFGWKETESRPAYWAVEVERSLFGNIKLSINSDLDYYFVKPE